MSVYFSRGVMYAVLKISGTLPVDRERLTSSVRNEEMVSMTDLSNSVSSGSSWQHLSGRARTAATASWLGTRWKLRNDEVDTAG